MRHIDQAKLAIRQHPLRDFSKSAQGRIGAVQGPMSRIDDEARQPNAQQFCPTILVSGPTGRRVAAFAEIDDETNHHASFMGLDQQSLAATFDHAFETGNPSRQKAFRGDAQEDSVVADERREPASLTRQSEHRERKRALSGA